MIEQAVKKRQAKEMRDRLSTEKKKRQSKKYEQHRTTITHKPTSRVLKIRYDQPITEFEIHAYIYSALRRAGVNVRGNISAIYDANRGNLCRFDIVIFEFGVASRIVEVKNGGPEQCGIRGQGRQCRRYREYGVPLTYVIGMPQAEKFVREYVASREM